MFYIDIQDVTHRAKKKQHSPIFQLAINQDGPSYMFQPLLWDRL